MAVCQSPATTAPAFDLLVALYTSSCANLSFLASMQVEMFYNRCKDLTKWDYTFSMGPRPNSGFVGLKNTDATCYMKLVLQQLFMLDKEQAGILAAEGACKEHNKDFSENRTILKQTQASRPD